VLLQRELPHGPGEWKRGVLHGREHSSVHVLGGQYVRLGVQFGLPALQLQVHSEQLVLHELELPGA
jgi:hypothetical protein